MGGGAFNSGNYIAMNRLWLLCLLKYLSGINESCADLSLVVMSRYKWNLGLLGCEIENPNFQGFGRNIILIIMVDNLTFIWTICSLSVLNYMLHFTSWSGYVVVFMCKCFYWIKVTYQSSAFSFFKFLLSIWCSFFSQSLLTVAWLPFLFMLDQWQ